MDRIITFIPDEELLEKVQPKPLTQEEAIKRIEESPMHLSLKKYLLAKQEDNL